MSAEPESTSGETGDSSTGSPAAEDGFAGVPGRRWNALAALALGLAILFIFRGLIGADPTREVPANIVTEFKDSEGAGDWQSLGETDLRYVVWLISRNAWALVHTPLSIFDAEICYPAKDALTYGESGIALGALAAPIRLVVGDPILTFNLTLIAMTILSALGMYLLIREWTACPPAGIVAALVYAFHVLKLGDVIHILIWDTSWTVFALYFATRLFARGSWRDASGLAVCILLQIAGSLYPLLAAIVIAIPFLGWLIVRFRLREVRLGQLAALAVTVAIAFGLFLAPYLRANESGELAEVAFQVYRPLSYLLPGGSGFSGWVIVLLVAIGLAMRGRFAFRATGGDPRVALVIGGLLVLGFSVVGGGDPGQATVPVLSGEAPPPGFPNLYFALKELIPGFEVGRGPGAMYGGVHLVLCALAGLGAAALLRALPARFVLAGSAALVLLAATDTLRPAAIGLAPRVDYRLIALGPHEDSLALFDELEERGDEGPLLEYPVKHANLYRASMGVLLSSYHHRQTSYCYNSVFPETIRAVEAKSEQLPSSDAIEALYALGFRTLVIHHVEGQLFADAHRDRFAAYASGPGASRLRRLTGNESLTAYRMLAQ